MKPCLTVRAPRLHQPQGQGPVSWTAELAPQCVPDRPLPNFEVPLEFQTACDAFFVGGRSLTSTRTMHRSTALKIATPSGAHSTSPEHKRFRTLLEKIDKARLRLQQWQEQLPLFAQAYKARVEPEEQRVLALRRAWAFELEQLLLGGRWSKNETKTLTRLLVDTCGALLDATEAVDAELKALYNRHAEIDFDSAEQEHLNAMKAMLESMGDLDLGDAPVESADELMQRAHEQMAQRSAQAREQHAAQGAAGGPAQGPKRGPGRRPSKAQTAAQTAAQKRAEEDARQASQTVREVYRKLAAVLHPDRTEAGASEGQRAERTALMQRANAAYEAGDLLALLTLQLQIEQVNEAQAAQMAASQLRHFNKVLTEQLREIEQEIDGRQRAFAESYGFMLEQRLDPLQLGRLLKEELRELDVATAQLATERRMLGGEPVQARRYVKRLLVEQQMDDELDDLFF